MPVLKAWSSAVLELCRQGHSLRKWPRNGANPDQHPAPPSRISCKMKFYCTIGRSPMDSRQSSTVYYERTIANLCGHSAFFNLSEIPRLDTEQTGSSEVDPKVVMASLWPAPQNSTPCQTLQFWRILQGVIIRLRSIPLAIALESYPEY